jgi:uncharacterized membrane protein YphA (DoxX/SURF4 family)
MALAGGLSILVGWRARAGAWLLVLFLVPVKLAMHAFRAVTDPMMRMMQMAMFMKNLAMLGGALLVAYWGAGPVSLDERARTLELLPSRRLTPQKERLRVLGLSPEGDTDPSLRSG